MYKPVMNHLTVMAFLLLLGGLNTFSLRAESAEPPAKEAKPDSPKPIAENKEYALILSQKEEDHFQYTLLRKVGDARDKVLLIELTPMPDASGKKKKTKKPKAGGKPAKAEPYILFTYTVPGDFKTEGQLLGDFKVSLRYVIPEKDKGKDKEEGEKKPKNPMIERFRKCMVKFRDWGKAAEERGLQDELEKLLPDYRDTITQLNYPQFVLRPGTLPLMRLTNKKGEKFWMRSTAGTALAYATNLERVDLMANQYIKYHTNEAANLFK